MGAAKAVLAMAAKTMAILLECILEANTEIGARVSYFKIEAKIGAYFLQCWLAVTTDGNTLPKVRTCPSIYASSSCNHIYAPEEMDC